MVSFTICAQFPLIFILSFVINGMPNTISIVNEITGKYLLNNKAVKRAKPFFIVSQIVKSNSEIFMFSTI